MNVYKDVLQSDLIDKLIILLQGTGERKVEYDLTTEVPPCVHEAHRILENKLESQFNTAILKKYSVSDVYKSQAYKSHRDPDVFSNSPLVFCSLSGRAILSVQANEIKEIECTKGTLVVLHHNEPHWVTPPQNKNGTRYFLFLGFQQ